MGFLGFTIFIIAIGILIADPIIEKATQTREEGPVDILDDSKRWICYVAALLGFILWFNPFIYNPAGERTYAQDPLFGTERIIFDPGYHFAGFFARTQEWNDVMSTVYDSKNPVKIRFNDATQATAQANIRWELPTDAESMLKLHKAYRTPNNLQNRTLEPYSRECLAFSAQLMESETHYSGGQSKLKEDFRDQLQNGQYVLETKVEYRKDTLTNEQIKITDVDLRKDQNGRAITIPFDVQKYNITVAFAAVPHVDYESIVDEKLQAKIDQSTKEAISKQELITAQQQALDRTRGSSTSSSK